MSRLLVGGEHCLPFADSVTCEGSGTRILGSCISWNVQNWLLELICLPHILFRQILLCAFEIQLQSQQLRCVINLSPVSTRRWFGCTILVLGVLVSAHAGARSGMGVCYAITIGGKKCGQNPPPPTHLQNWDSGFGLQVGLGKMLGSWTPPHPCLQNWALGCGLSWSLAAEEF